MSLGSLTSEHMLPTILAAFFLLSVLRSRRPRETTGTISASDGASTVLTKTVLRSVSRHALVCLLGSAMAAMSAGTSF